jgi:drug/metabolite transporter (DMT)-like permease
MEATVAVLLGVLVALTYGAGDFLGGLSSRRVNAAIVALTSQLVGWSILVVLVAVLPERHPPAADVVRGAIAGSVGLIGVVLLYRGLASGAMGVVAPITAVGAAVLPVAWGLLTGEEPGAVHLVGVVLALVAVGLVSSPASGAEPVPGRAKEVALALVSGAAFGVVFILLGDTTEASGMWPLLAARSASATLMAGVVLARRAPVKVPVGSRLQVIGTGVFDVTANAIFVLAARIGLLSLVAVVSSLYPVSTVVLARVVLHERVGRRQQLGLALAIAGVVLIAA